MHNILSEKLKVWKQAMRGEQPIVDHKSSWEFKFFEISREGHYLPEPATSYFTLYTDNQEVIEKKGVVSEYSFAHSAYRQIRDLRSVLRKNGVKNYLDLGRYDRLDYTEAAAFILNVASPKAVEQFFEIIELKQQGKWPEGKQVVIVNGSIKHNKPQEGRRFSHIIDEFKDFFDDDIKIVNKKSEVAPYLIEKLGGDVVSKSPNYPKDEVVLEPTTRIFMNTGNFKKPYEAKGALFLHGFVGHIYRWSQKIANSFQAPELQMTAIGNNKEKIDFAFCSLFFETMKWMKYNRKELFAKTELYQKIIDDLQENKFPHDGRVGIINALKEEGVYDDFHESISKYMEYKGFSDKDMGAVDDRSMEIYITNKKGKRNYELSLKLFSETEAFRKLREEGVLNVTKICPGVELANVIKKIGGVKEFYSLVKDAAEEIVDKYGKKYGFDNIEDLNLIVDDIQTYIMFPIVQDDYVDYKKVITHSIRTNKLFLEPKGPDLGYITSEFFQGPINSSNGARHIEDEGYITMGSPMARAIRAVMQLTSGYKHSWKLSYDPKYQINMQGKKFFVGVSDKDAAAMIKEYLPEGWEAITPYDEEFGLVESFKNGDDIVSGAFEKYLEKCDCFIKVPDYMMQGQKNNLEVSVEIALHRMQYVGHEIADPLIADKRIIILEDDNGNMNMVSFLIESELAMAIDEGMSGALPQYIREKERNLDKIKTKLLDIARSYNKDVIVSQPAVVLSDRQANFENYSATIYTSAASEADKLKNIAVPLARCLALLKFTVQTGGGAEGGMKIVNDSFLDAVDYIREKGIYSEEEIEKYIQLRLIQCEGTHLAEGTFSRKNGNENYNIYSVRYGTIRARENALGMTKYFVKNVIGTDDYSRVGGNSEIAIYGGNGTMEERDLAMVFRVADPEYYSKSPLNMVGEYYKLYKEKILDKMSGEVNAHVHDDFTGTLIQTIRARREAGQEPFGVNYRTLLDTEFSDIPVEIAQQIVAEGEAYQRSLMQGKALKSIKLLP